MKAKYYGILSAILGSICCIGPLLLVVLGLGTLGAVIGRYHWFFTRGAIAVLAWAWMKYLRERVRAREHRSIDRRGMSLVTLLVASAIVIPFAALNIGNFALAGSSAAAPLPRNTNLKRIAIPVEGMTCATCEIGVRYALKSVTGVESARVSAATKTATIDYDPVKTNPEQLVDAINSTGYRATMPRSPSAARSSSSPRSPPGAAADPGRSGAASTRSSRPPPASRRPRAAQTSPAPCPSRRSTTRPAT